MQGVLLQLPQGEPRLVISSTSANCTDGISTGCNGSWLVVQWAMLYEVDALRQKVRWVQGMSVRSAGHRTATTATTMVVALELNNHNHSNHSGGGACFACIASRLFNASPSWPPGHPHSGHAHRSGRKALNVLAPLSSTAWAVSNTTAGSPAVTVTQAVLHMPVLSSGIPACPGGAPGAVTSAGGFVELQVLVFSGDTNYTVAGGEVVETLAGNVKVRSGERMSKILSYIA